MDNAGVIYLGRSKQTEFPVSTAGEYEGDWVTELAGMTVLDLVVRFHSGVGDSGRTVTVYLQTSVDDGATAIDIASVKFGASDSVVGIRWNAWGVVATGDLTDAGIALGAAAISFDAADFPILGNQLRLRAIADQDYTGGLISARAHVR